MGGKAWDSREREVLRLYASEGAFTIGKLIERSERAVESEAKRLGVSLAAYSSTPRRDAEWHIKRIVEGVGAPLCPQCGKRLAVVKREGICRACHLDNLIEQRERELQESVNAKREAMRRKADGAR